MHHPSCRRVLGPLSLLLMVMSLQSQPARAVEPQPEVSVAAYPSIQTAVDANPGRSVYVPAGDYPITAKIRLRTDGSGLVGPGRIIQQAADQPIIEVEDCNGAEIRDLSLTRPEGKQETTSEGILALKCHDLVLGNVRIIDNRTRASAIELRDCHGARISRCLVRNYTRVTVDDRTADANRITPSTAPTEQEFS